MSSIFLDFVSDGPATNEAVYFASGVDANAFYV